MDDLFTDKVLVIRKTYERRGIVKTKRSQMGRIAWDKQSDNVVLWIVKESMKKK